MIKITARTGVPRGGRASSAHDESLSACPGNVLNPGGNVLTFKCGDYLLGLTRCDSEATLSSEICQRRLTRSSWRTPSLTRGTRNLPCSGTSAAPSSVAAATIPCALPSFTTVT